MVAGSCTNNTTSEIESWKSRTIQENSEYSNLIYQTKELFNNMGIPVDGIVFVGIEGNELVGCLFMMLKKRHRHEQYCNIAPVCQERMLQRLPCMN